MGVPFNGSIARIAAEAGCTEDQAQRAVTAAFRSLHRTTVTDQRSATAATLQTYSLFSLEACYHFVGTLEETRVTTDPDLPWSETMARFAPHLRPFRAILDKWRAAGERPAYCRQIDSSLCDGFKGAAYWSSAARH